MPQPRPRSPRCLVHAPLVVACLTFALFAAAPADAVPVTFRAEVPACTPPTEAVFVRSNRADRAAFVHDALQRIDRTHVEGTLDVVTAPAEFEYKYSLGICDDASCPGVEKSISLSPTAAAEVDPRKIAAGATTVNDEVAVWRDAVWRFDGGARAPMRARNTDEKAAFCGPYLSYSSEKGQVTIGYDAYRAGSVVLQYGRTLAYGTTLTASGRTRNFFRLDDLTPGATYHYRLIEDGVVGEDATFRMQPAAGEPVRIGFLGDTQVYGPAEEVTVRALVQQLVAFAPHVVLSPGDLVASMYTGGRAFDPPEIGRFGNFYNLAAPLLRTAPFMVAMGNHEEDVDYFWSAFSFPTPDAPRLDHYWFKIGNVHVTALYTGATLGYSVAGILDSERDWLDRVLTDADNDPAVRWKIVFLHRGAFSQGAHHPTDGYELYEGREGRRGFGEVWERHKVDLVLSGHNHNFTWAENAGVHYVTSCGGAPAHELLPDLRETTLVAEETCVAGELSLDARTISYRAVRPDGSVIDDATFSLCHADADCSELPTPCPEDAAWRCVDHTCAAMCLARPDAGVVVEDAGIEPSVDAGLEKDAGAVLDAGLADAGCIDAGSIHAGCIDAGSIDAGSIDAGSIDAGSGDAGHVDSGSVAVGSIDAGAVIVDSLDAGPVVVDGPFDGGAHPLPTPGADDAGGLPDGCGCASADTSSLGLGCAMLGLFTGQRRRRRARR